MTDLRLKVLRAMIKREAEFGRPMTPVEAADRVLVAIKEMRV